MEQTFDIGFVQHRAVGGIDQRKTSINIANRANMTTRQQTTTFVGLFYSCLIEHISVNWAR